MTEAQELADILKKRGAGKTAEIIACICTILGILFLGFIFVPLAVVIATFGTIIAIKNSNGAGIGINVLAGSYHYRLCYIASFASNDRYWCINIKYSKLPKFTPPANWLRGTHASARPLAIR